MMQKRTSSSCSWRLSNCEIASSFFLELSMALEIKVVIKSREPKGVPRITRESTKGKTGSGMGEEGNG